MHPNVEAYIHEQSQEHRSILLACRAIILSLSPKIEECFSYKVPFYKYHGMLCYLNVIKNKCYVGLCQGSQLADEYGFLEKGNRTMVQIMPIEKMTLEKQEALQNYLLQSILILDHHKKRKS
jgi:hypothetical protein